MRTTGTALGLWVALWLVPAVALADFTDLTPGPGARVVHVSSSAGTNSNDGLSEATPKATIAAGFAQLRNGFGDHLLLKRGDTFLVSSPLIWTKSGASARELMVFGAYGAGARPVIDAGGGEALQISPGFQSANTVRHVAVAGLHFHSAQRDFTQPGFDIGSVTIFGVGIRVVGVQTTAPQIVEDLLIEDCEFRFLGQALVLEGPYADSVRGVVLRRNLILDSYSTVADTNGMYVSNVRGLLIEENLIDGIQRAPGLSPAAMTSARSHGVYVQSTARDVTLRRNIIARAFDGGLMRPGGVYEGNLVMDVYIGTHQGYMYSPSAPIITEGVATRVSGNAFLKLGGRQGVNAGNIRQGSITDNVILSGAVTGGNGISLIGSTDLGQVGVHDLVIEDNFILGLRGLRAFGTTIDTVTVRENQLLAGDSSVVDLQNYAAGDYQFIGNAYRSQAAANRWFVIDQSVYYDLAGWTTFIGESGATTGPAVDPSSALDVEDYHASIGGAPALTAFLDEARQQSRQNWRDAYTAAPVIAYLRQGLGLPPISTALALGLTLTPSTARAGDLLRVDLQAANPGAEVMVDVFFAVLLPAALVPAAGCPDTSALVFLADAFQQAVVRCLSSSPASLPPLYRQVLIPGNLPLVTVPAFFSTVLSGVPSGDYVITVAVSPAGAFLDGTVDAGDVLALATATLTVQP